MATTKIIKYNTITKDRGDYKREPLRHWHAHQHFQPRENFPLFSTKRVTAIFLYCLNDADISFLDSEMSTELNDIFIRSSRANLKNSARLELVGRGQI